MDEIRIHELSESAELANGDNFVIDNANSRGTKRYSVSEFMKLIPKLVYEWTPMVGYGQDVLVTYEGKLYRNKTDSTAISPTWQGSTVWEEVNLSTVLLNMILSVASLYDGNKTYNIGDYCIHAYGLYRCTGTTTGTWDSSKWTDDVNAMSSIYNYIKGTVLSNFTSKRITPGVSEFVEKGEIYIINDYMYKAIVDTQTSPLDMDDWEEVTVESLLTDIDATIDEALETKADKSGVYGDIVSGNVKSNSYEVDTAPYLYRPSKDGSAVEEEIVGGTVAWNQLVQNGNFASTANWSTFRSTLTVNNNVGTLTLGASPVASAQINQAIEIPANHKIMLCGELNSSVAGDISIRTFKSSSGGGTSDAITVNVQANSWTKYNVVRALNTDTTKVFAIYAVATENSTLQLKNIQIIDLTQAFGSTIADYIYSLEQATSGSGIAWLKSYGFLTKDYYAYDSGSLQSVNVASRKIVGFNQWDEEWELISDVINSKNYIPVLPNTQYYFTPHQGRDYCCFDSEFNLIRDWTWFPPNNTTFTTPSNCCYIKFRMTSYYGTTYNNDICINISDTSKNGTYEPYTKHTYPLDSDLTLRGIPKLDSNNKLYYDGDIYKSDGGVKRKYGIVDLGSLTWVKGNMNTENTGRIFYSILSSSPMKQPSDNGIVSDKLVYNPFSNWSAGQWERQILNGITVTNSAALVACVPDNYSTASDFKTAMNGVYLVYELATPTSETADAFENPQLVFSGGTEEFIDGATRDVAIPVGQNSKYYLDIKGKVEQLYGIPEPPSTNGTYKLVCTVSSGVKTYSWVSN